MRSPSLSYKEWVRKPFTAIGYGGAGAARAIEHLRQITTALQMVSTASTVNIGCGDFMSTSPSRSGIFLALTLIWIPGPD